MNNIFVLAAIISIIFVIFKFIEMRFIDKEPKPLKFLIRDALLVYVSVVSGYFIVEQIQPIVKKSSDKIPIFTDNPEF